MEIASWKMKHKNIVENFDCFVDNNKVYIVMEYCPLGDLNKYLIEHTAVQMTQRISFMVDMAEGLTYLHSKNIIHRDLKPENVLLSGKNDQIICKISDFGISKILMSEDDTCMTYIGSRLYMAPEITGKTEYSSAVDVFSLGIIYFAVYKSREQRLHKDCVRNLKKKMTACLKEEHKRWKTFEDEFMLHFKDSPDIGQYILKMLQMDPLERPKISDVLIYIRGVKKPHEIFGKCLLTLSNFEHNVVWFI